MERGREARVLEQAEARVEEAVAGAGEVADEGEEEVLQQDRGVIASVLSAAKEQPIN